MSYDKKKKDLKDVPQALVRASYIAGDLYAVLEQRIERAAGSGFPLGRFDISMSLAKVVLALEIKYDDPELKAAFLDCYKFAKEMKQTSENLVPDELKRFN